MKYVLLRHTVENPDEIRPGCALDGEAEQVAEYADLNAAKAALRQLRSSVTVTEYFLYKVASNGDLSSMDCTDGLLRFYPGSNAEYN